MNELETAINAKNQTDSVDFYLDMTPTAEIIQHIEEIRKAAAMQTDGGRLRESMLKLLSDNTDIIDE